MSLALKFVASRQWAILDEYLGLIGAVADRDLEMRDQVIQSIEKQWGRPVPGTRETTIRNGIAIIPVAGPMFRYANMFTEISGATSFERLALDIGTVMDDPAVERVVFDINSPGGEVDGTAETSELIWSYRGVKPMTSYISHLGASAAYWIASAADEVIISRTSMVGSIGAVLGVVDRSGRDEEMGIRRMEFVSSFAKDKRLDPFSEDDEEAQRAKAKIQAMVDQIGLVFVEMVASNRGITPARVKQTEGGLFIGEDAIRMGLADGLGTLEGLIERYSGGSNKASTLSMSIVADGLDLETEEMVMTTEANVPTTLEAEPITIDFLTSNHSDLVEQIRTGAAEAERERIMSIFSLDAQGFDGLKEEMMRDPTATAGSAAQAILMAKGEQEKIRAQAVQAAMDEDEGELKNVASVPVPAEDGTPEDQLASSVLRFMPKAQAAV